MPQSLIAHLYVDRHPARVGGLVLVDTSFPGMSLWPGDDDVRLDGDGDQATVIDTVAGAAEILDARPPRVPAVVVCRTPGRWYTPVPDPTADGRWQQHQANLAEQLGAPLIVATNSGHAIPREAPALIAYAVDAVVDAVRAGRPVAVDPARVQAVGGRLQGRTGDAIAREERP